MLRDGTNRSSLLSVLASYIRVHCKLDVAWGQASDVILVLFLPALLPPDALSFPEIL